MLRLHVFWWGIILAGVLGCTQEDNLMLKVDMASMHDEGVFVPDLGDKVEVAGNFNNWELGSAQLTDHDGDWVYEINASNLLSEQMDTVNFKFVITSKNSRDLTNNGWETITNRSIEKNDLNRFAPVFEFNRPWSPLIERELQFRVNMSNQEVLEFFEPDKGDKIIVTGNFNNWDPEGIELEKVKGTSLYAMSFPVEIREDRSIEYKFKIQTGNQGGDPRIIPNNGWENLQNRIYSDNTATQYFNNQKRILRVIVSENLLNKKKKLTQDDYLHLKLSWNGSQSRNYRLTDAKEGIFETALSIPESAADLKGDIIANYTTKLLSIDNIQVGLEGKEMIIE